MNYKFFPHTAEDLEKMLLTAGVTDMQQLFKEIPSDLIYNKEYNIPSAMSEIELRKHFESLGNKNKTLTVFAGAGAYDHYTPSAIPNLVQRSEFLTSYTPYQAEISQGTLHYIFEYQSMMAMLTGMDISNASMYDGATATAEAAIMALHNAKKADTVLMSSTVDDKVRKVVDTYAHFHGFNIKTIAEDNGSTSKADLMLQMQAGGVAGVIVQQPNKYGNIEDFSGFADACHDNKALFIINSIIADLALLKTPREWGADVAVGDSQSLGIPLSFGGPYVGYMCVTEKLMRKMPGRIVGATQDNRGNRAFVLTLQAREQHIRRQKATSNICSNQSLMALWVTIYLSLMGKEGLKQAAQMSFDGAHYLQQQLIATGRFTATHTQPFFNEFCLNFNGNVNKLQQYLTDNGIMGGIKMGESTIMFAVTEKRTKEEMDKLVSLIKNFQ